MNTDEHRLSSTARLTHHNYHLCPSVSICGSLCRGYTWIGLVLMLFCAGCDGGRTKQAAIQGEGKLDGKPVERGTIQFMPMQGVEGSIATAEITGGRYQLSGKVSPAVGWNRVEIHALRRTGRTIRRSFPGHGTMDEEVEAVAPRFNSESTLKFEIKPGENTADFEVASK
jgi:hypothetical protein